MARMRTFRATVALLGLALPFGGASAQQTWSHFNGDLKAQKYSPLTQITPENVGKLRAAWRVHTGDKAGPGVGPTGVHNRPMPPRGKIPATVWSATPIFVNDTLYLGTPFYRIFAIEPDTGRVKWTYDSKSALEALTQPDLKNRGVAYWQSVTADAGQPCQKRVYIGTMDAKLHSVDADTGQTCKDFGKDGVVDINVWNSAKNKWPLSILQPPTVFKDFLFVGWAGKDWEDSEAPAGSLFALDARTGELRWTFEALPKDIAAKTGTSNIWASMSVDEERDILYIPVSSPSPNFYGGNRLAPIPLGTSVTALKIQTGEILWSRQLVHHDLWDFDTNSAATLVDITKDGQTIPALVQTSKQGFIYVLNRLTGEPIYPIDERPVPQSKVDGEVSSPTQPYVAKPQPVVGDQFPGIFWLADVSSGGYCTRTLKTLVNEGRFTPPSLQGSLIYPATIGGVEWGGGAVDPGKQIFVVNNTSAVQIYKLLKRDDYNKATSVGGSETGGYFPMLGAPYGIQLTTFLNPLGMPCWNPPYGSISAYDLKTGERLWNKPFGRVQKWGFYMPESWGTVTIGGPVVTASGLIFIGASMDSRVRALDMKTGNVLWQANVSAPAVSLPAVYQYKSKQYVVFAAGGNSILTPRVSDEIVAFTLPD
ncbi:quinoprotein glucose dehydrogenase [Variibacter gotjawalensis]|uniref:Quinoprotein glucose dehydrogenase n=1 Tax=Variibacter gotjawalensis TaxID=1333996 RepID=A0A0S3PUA8_9BRAD|nr:pyrroloquinoline quinone-dependent dehydrogenase [Variibacter gotjawalensis]NIK49879.1 quinoprotein glucose dehydrogenase [Variibacter gotjawalensis]RZS45878.1 quinoprotein glucose dehydrogenase [Variibacter gotjawalensis]BAT59553.1 quinoprotein glucose dehydrogenase [Variibacter gotjawalensis]